METILTIWLAVIAIIVIALIVDILRRKQIKNHKANRLVEVGTEAEELFITGDPDPNNPTV